MRNGNRAARPPFSSNLSKDLANVPINHCGGIAGHHDCCKTDGLRTGKVEGGYKGKGKIASNMYWQELVLVAANFSCNNRLFLDDGPSLLFARLLAFSFFVYCTCTSSPPLAKQGLS